MLSDLFFDFGGFADSVAQIEQFCSSDFTFSYYLNRLNVGRMERESFFGTDAERYTANGEGLADTAVSLGDDGSFKNLSSDSCAFNDAAVNFNAVAYVERRDVFLLKLLFCKSLQ